MGDDSVSTRDDSHITFGAVDAKYDKKADSRNSYIGKRDSIWTMTESVLQIGKYKSPVGTVDISLHGNMRMKYSYF